MSDWERVSETKGEGAAATAAATETAFEYANFVLIRRNCMVMIRLLIDCDCSTIIW